MFRLWAILAAASMMAACANPGASTMAPTGIKAANGGGEQMLGVVGSSGALRTTVVQ